MAKNMIQNSPVGASFGGLSHFSAGIARDAVRIAPVALIAAVLVTGCQRTSGVYQGGGLPTQQSPTSLEPAPLPPVQQGELQPAAPTGQEGIPAVPGTPGTEETTQVAAAEPPVGAQPVTRQAMVGAWTVSTGGSNCQIFLALTKWSGGYRAASRGCSAPAISDVQAWDVKGKQVVLVTSAGNTAATLYRSSEQRYDGSTNGGGAISFTR
ncbi:MAG: protease inhibitor Inh/omp19 family protein [Rhizobiaceae bacterium]